MTSSSNKQQSNRLPWLLLAGVLLLIVAVIAITTVRRVQRGRELMQRGLTAQAELLITSLEGATRAGLRHQVWGLLRLQSLVEEMLRQPNIHSLVIMGGHGELLAAGVARPGVVDVEKAALADLPPDIVKLIKERKPFSQFLANELAMGRPFKPLAPWRGKMPPPPPPWERYGQRRGMGQGRGMGPGMGMGRESGEKSEQITPEMQRHHDRMMRWLEDKSQPPYVLVRLSTRSFQKAQRNAIGGALMLAALIFGGAAVVAGGMFFYARRRQDELERLRLEVAESQHLAAVGRLAGSVAHEIRNPLSALRGLVQFMAKGSDPDSRQAECGRMAVSEVDRLERVVSGLLDFTRTRTPRMVPLDLNESVAGTLRLLQGETRAQGVELVFQPRPELPAVKADPDQVRQILMNLLINALEANNGSGSVKVEILPGKGAVSIVVRDQGPGLPVSDPQQLFDPFFSTKERGTGLGLAIARRLARGLGGDLNAANAKDGGATFTLNLPVREP